MLVLLWTALALVCLCQGLNVPASNLDQCTSHTLDNHRLNATRLKYDDVTAQRVDAGSARDCVQKCCLANATAKHTCSIAEYDSRLEIQNCVLVFCHWLDEECQNNVIAGGAGNVSTFSIIQAVMAPSAAIDQILSDSTPKIERTIKPRKGVGIVAAEQVTKHPVTSVALPTPFATESNDSDTTTDSAVSPDTVSTPVAETTSTGYSSSTTSGELSAVTASTDVTPLPDLDADKHKHTVPRKGVLGGFSEVSPEGSEHSKSAVPESKLFENYKGISSGRNKILIHSQNVSNLGPTTGSKKEIAVAPAQEMASSLKSPETPAPASDKKNAGSHVYQNESPDKITFVSPVPANWTVTTETQTGSSFVHVVPPTKEQLKPPTATVSSVAPPTTNDIYLNSQQTDELTIQQSVYLIASLIIGFLVLLTVIGLVMRHVHGVWERRHYQRMDFLIDGMYNNM